eukprot:6134050-Pleurochrysis_carterae.AAC.2
MLIVSLSCHSCWQISSVHASKRTNFSRAFEQERFESVEDTLDVDSRSGSETARVHELKHVDLRTVKPEGSYLNVKRLSMHFEHRLRHQMARRRGPRNAAFRAGAHGVCCIQTANAGTLPLQWA